MSKYRNPVLFALLIVSVTVFYFNAGTTKLCNFEVKGTLKVKLELGAEVGAELWDKEVPLNKIKIRVKSKKCKACGWESWGTTRTSDNGDFNMSKTLSGKYCDNGAYLKLESKFLSSDMEMREESIILEDSGNKAKWIQVGYRKNSNCSSKRVCNFGNIAFKNGAKYKRGDEVYRRRAEIWYYYTLASEIMEDAGYPINRNNGERIVTIYPFNRLINPDSKENSYVSVGSEIIHLVKTDRVDGFDIYTILHELGHVVNFRYTSNEGVAIWPYFASHFTTHGVVSVPQIGYYEGFAGWFENIMLNKIRQKLDMTVYPAGFYNVNFLKAEEKVSGHEKNCVHHDEGRIECHMKGWENIFNLVTLNDVMDDDLSSSEYIYDYNFYADAENVYASSEGGYSLDDRVCENMPVQLTLGEMMDVFLDVDQSDLTLDNVMDLFQEKTGAKDSDIQAVLDNFDVTNNKSLRTHYCKKTFSNSPRYKRSFRNTR